MAGLQYNFFPTDFFYPRPSNSGAAATVDKSSSALSLQQYYFFPTDFFYPRSPQSLQLQVNNNNKQRAAPLQIKKRDFSNDLEFPTTHRRQPGVPGDKPE
ncbi:hypothetical protein OWV82_019962 [Melia azedarach]|uniref:Uncharacterized protein n=1 Tax=Melia azedarach TaxID=155640 RepID=A0ACC1X4E3_MELAZ|nr:hypothetical protein OWV82_019962 [Melia azedarach]